MDKIENPPTQVDASGMPMFEWKFEATMQVSATWLADGYDLTQERLQEMFEGVLANSFGWARSDEATLVGRVTKSPPTDHIKICQGYKPVPEGREWDAIRSIE